MTLRATLFIPLALAACDGSGRRVGSGPSRPGSGNADAGSVAPDTGVATPASACLEAINCVDTTDCGEGTRCNTALPTATCQRVLCGPAGTLCSEDGLCATDHRCVDRTCHPCLRCGEECVLIETDPNHCGGCGMAVRSAQDCVGGQPVCRNAGEMLCGAECVSRTSDADHCGACNAACDTGSCYGGTCASLSRPWMSGPTTCDAVCSAESKTCVVVGALPMFLGSLPSDPGAGVAVYGTEGDNEPLVVATCAVTPAAMLSTRAFAGMFCMCR